MILSQLLLSCSDEKKSNIFNIAIVSIVEIDPIAQLRNGFKEEFSNSDFAKSNKYNFSEYNAQNDAGIQVQIIDKLTTDKPDLIYVLGTPLAQSIQRRLPEVLLVQGTSTDPVAANLADSWEGSGRKYIATTDLPPIDIQINLIKSLTPQVSRLGVIYNPGEVNSIAVIRRLKEYIIDSKTEISLIERPIASSAEVATAVNSLIGKSDAIYLPPDNTAHAAIPVIGKICYDLKIPFYATVESALDYGALSTLSLDFYEMGKETARLALEVINGKSPENLPIRASTNPIISINSDVAQRLGISIERFKEKKNYRIK